MNACRPMSGTTMYTTAIVPPNIVFLFFICVSFSPLQPAYEFISLRRGRGGVNHSARFKRIFSKLRWFPNSNSRSHKLSKYHRSWQLSTAHTAMIIRNDTKRAREYLFFHSSFIPYLFKRWTPRIIRTQLLHFGPSWLDFFTITRPLEFDKWQVRRLTKRLAMAFVVKTTIAYNAVPTSILSIFIGILSESPWSDLRSTTRSPASNGQKSSQALGGGQAFWPVG